MRRMEADTESLDLALTGRVPIWMPPEPHPGVPKPPRASPRVLRALVPVDLAPNPDFWCQPP